MVCALLGRTVSTIDGFDVGAIVGLLEGLSVRREVGRMDCAALGMALFITDGLDEDSALGRLDGLRLGKDVG